MTQDQELFLPAALRTELEGKYFWWDNVGTQPRSDARVLAQAMDLAGFAEILRLESEVGRSRLLHAMRRAEPGWLSPRSWELWRGRLSAATGEALPDAPPQRHFDDATF